MDVDNSNFESQLNDINEAIQNATFLSIDGEFSGLRTIEVNQGNTFDTLHERYSSTREAGSKFLMIQFGLCAFKLLDDSHSYEARPYNFFIFPRPYCHQSPDEIFMCQSSSIKFLTKCGFDFNRVFHKGISYLTPAQEDMMRTKLLNTSSAFSASTKSDFVPKDQTSFIDGICEKVKHFLNDDVKVDSLHLPACFSFQRKLIYLTISSKFPSLCMETHSHDRQFHIVVRRMTGDEKMMTEEDKCKEDLIKLDSAVGFSKVIQMISKSGKLVAGHNLLLDVMHLLSQFCHELPTDLDDFKLMLNSFLPKLLDTKWMASSHPFTDLLPQTGLSDLHKTLAQHPFETLNVEFADGFDKYDGLDDMFHEAGYDAYVTGCALITMTMYLGKNIKEGVAIPSCDMLQPYINKLFLMRLNGIPCLNITQKDGKIYIAWINSTSAFILLHTKNRAARVKRALGQPNSVFQLMSYEEFKALAAEASGDMPNIAHCSTVKSTTGLGAGIKRLSVKGENISHKKICSDYLKRL